MSSENESQDTMTNAIMKESMNTLKEMISGFKIFVVSKSKEID